MRMQNRYSIEIKNLKKSYDNGRSFAVNDISFNVDIDIKYINTINAAKTIINILNPESKQKSYTPWINVGMIILSNNCCLSFFLFPFIAYCFAKLRWCPMKIASQA